MISANKVFFLDNGEFGVVRVSLPEMTVAAAMAHLGVTELCPMDKAEAVEGDVVIELAQQKAWTYNRYVFSPRKM